VAKWPNSPSKMVWLKITGNSVAWSSLRSRTRNPISPEDQASKRSVEFDVYQGGLEHNDRAILEASNVGFCKIVVKKRIDKIICATIVAERAGEISMKCPWQSRTNLNCAQLVAIFISIQQLEKPYKAVASSTSIRSFRVLTRRRLYKIALHNLI
jgi:hypothetical protein